MASWMGATGRYTGPSLAERTAVREASKIGFYVRMSRDVTKLGLRTAFADAGCTVLDARVVFRNGESTGVGYVDVADEASIVAGLKLDGTQLLGAPFKVRRNMDKSALQQLVRTKGWRDKQGDKAGSSVDNQGQKKADDGGRRRRADIGFYVRMSRDVTKEMLRTAFTDAGCAVIDARLMFRSGKPTGAGFVDVADEVSIAAGLKLDGTELLGSPLKVRRNVDKLAQTKGAKRGPPASHKTEEAGGAAAAAPLDPAAALAKRVKKKQKKHNKREKARRTQAAMQADPALAESVQRLIKERQTARDAKDWNSADAIRDKLKAKGVRITDTPSGAVWHLID